MRLCACMCMFSSFKLGSDPKCSHACENFPENERPACDDSQHVVNRKAQSNDETIQVSGLGIKRKCNTSIDLLFQNCSINFRKACFQLTFTDMNPILYCIVQATPLQGFIMSTPVVTVRWSQIVKPSPKAIYSSKKKVYSMFSLLLYHFIVTQAWQIKVRLEDNIQNDAQRTSKAAGKIKKKIAKIHVSTGIAPRNLRAYWNLPPIM